MRVMRVAALLLFATVGAVVTSATPAAAHGGGMDPTDHRAELIGLEPAVDGVRVRLVDSGTRIELDAGGHDVLVLGYEGEPYLRVDAGGVSENRRSPSTYLNRSLDGEAPPPEADADAAPDWHRIGDGPTVRWHDHALHVPPAQRAGARTTSDWERPIVIDGAPVALHGRIVTAPSPSPWGWLGAAAVVALGVVLGCRRAWRATMVTALAVMIVADVARVYGLVFGAPTWLASRVEVATDTVTMSVVGCAMAIAAIVLLVQRRRIEGATAAALAGAVLAIVGGVLELDDLRAAHLGSALPDGAARLSVMLVLGTGAGVVVSSLLELRRRSSTPARPAPRTGSEPTPEDGRRTGLPESPPSG